MRSIMFFYTKGDDGYDYGAYHITNNNNNNIIIPIEPTFFTFPGAGHLMKNLLQDTLDKLSPGVKYTVKKPIYDRGGQGGGYWYQAPLRIEVAEGTPVEEISRTLSQAGVMNNYAKNKEKASFYSKCGPRYCWNQSRNALDLSSAQFSFTKGIGYSIMSALLVVPNLLAGVISILISPLISLVKLVAQTINKACISDEKLPLHGNTLTH